VVTVKSVDTRSGFNAGVLWNLSDSWSLGFAHRSGADFEFDDPSLVDHQITATLPDVTAVGARWWFPFTDDT
jgi:long-subunit fatty acid transport protein